MFIMTETKNEIMADKLVSLVDCQRYVRTLQKEGFNSFLANEIKGLLREVKNVLQASISGKPKSSDAFIM